MKILKIIKINNIKYKIELDKYGQLITYEDVILKYKLLNKEQINLSIIKQIEQENEYYEIYYKLINFIKRRIRSELEIKKYLEKETNSEQIKQQIIATLKQQNLLNDEIFVKAYIADKLNLNNYGPNKIKDELLKHNINEEIIEKQLKQIDQLELAQKLYKLIKKEIDKNNKHSQYELYQKILTKFVLLGHNKEQIKDIFNNSYKENELILKNEYEKYYNYFQNKYNEKEVFNKIEQKLYNRGFLIDKIKRLTKHYKNKGEK